MLCSHRRYRGLHVADVSSRILYITHNMLYAISHIMRYYTYKFYLILQVDLPVEMFYTYIVPVGNRTAVISLPSI